ncbi:MAG TPA: UbiD family decarboxylase [candidate division Zixibacteria bacterium]|nr:UbiD family decarboxylase [candidate division Zixibacteria bacterium]
MPKDLRDFLREIEAEEPQQLLRVQREVDPRFEVTGVLARLEKERKFPIVIFEKVRGSALPVVTNVHADARRLFRAIGLKNASLPEFIREYAAREDSPLPPVIVGEAPVQEIVSTGSEVDVTRLPILTYHEKDAGRYITAGFGIMRDPDSGVRNAGIYRLMVHSPDTLGVQLSETAHGHYIWQAYERRDRPTPMAVAIGHHPAFYIGCLSFTSLETDEFAVAGGILGEPVELVRCRTLDLEVPARAEIVLECEIPPRVRKPEAPFGEYPGTYGPQRNNPIVRVKAITMRRDALYQSSFVGHADNLLLSGIVRSTTIMKTVKLASPKVRAVHVPPSGRCRFICYLAIEKIIEGEPKNAAMAAFAADPFLKYVVVVDQDVDILSDDEVLHAIATRVRADTDIFMVTHAKGSPLDPASYDPAAGSHLVTKVGVDATRKANYPEEIRVPGADSIKLEDYLPGWSGRS